MSLLPIAFCLLPFAYSSGFPIDKTQNCRIHRRVQFLACLEHLFGALYIDTMNIRMVHLHGR